MTTEQHPSAGDRDSSKTETDILVTENLTKRFGGLIAIDGVNLRLREGEILGLIGPNGSGKSTFVNTVMGIYNPDDGDVFFRGKRITNMAPHKRSMQGLVKSFQYPRLFTELTVSECLLLAYQQHDGQSFLHRFRPHPDRNYERVRELVSFLELKHLADKEVDALSGGQRKLLDLGLSIISDPDVVLLDEPTAGVNPTLINDIAYKIRELNDDGTTILVIGHNMDFLMSISNRVAVLNEGQLMMVDEPEVVQSSDEVRDAYFGGSIE